MPEIKFEEALKKLEKIVEDLEKGDLSLDEALKKYQEGIELSKVCAQRLETAKSAKSKADGALEQIERRWRDEEKIKSVDEAKVKV